MKSSYKALIAAGALLVVLGLAAPFAYSQVVRCCHWEGTGNGELYIDVDGDNEKDTVKVAQVWHANVFWRASDTSRDTIIGCWYDDRGHGGPMYGYRDHSEDSAFGKFVLTNTDDSYCSDNIHNEPSTPISVPFKAEWTGCCDEPFPEVDGDWFTDFSNGTFQDTAYTCYGDTVPQCE